MSIGCVSNVASITCAAVASAASTSPRAKAVVGLEHVRRSGREGLRRMDQRGARLQRRERIGERFEDLVVDRHRGGGLTRVEPRIGDDHREEVGDAARQLPFGDEHRLIRIVEAGAAVAGNVGGGEHADDAGHRRRCVGVNLQDLRARVLGQHHRAVQHAGHAHVVDKRLFAQRLLQSAMARDRSADPVMVAVAVAVAACRGANAGLRLNPRSSPK